MSDAQAATAAAEAAADALRSDLAEVKARLSSATFASESDTTSYAAVGPAITCSKRPSTHMPTLVS